MKLQFYNPSLPKPLSTKMKVDFSLLHPLRPTVLGIKLMESLVGYWRGVLQHLIGLVSASQLHSWPLTPSSFPLEDHDFLCSLPDFAPSFFFFFSPTFRPIFSAPHCFFLIDLNCATHIPNSRVFSVVAKKNLADAAVWVHPNAA